MMSEADIDIAITGLEAEMQDLHFRHRDLFAYANAWAERYDAILNSAPEPLRALVEQRLQRVGVRWGVAQGARVTLQFPALKLPA